MRLIVLRQKLGIQIRTIPLDLQYFPQLTSSIGEMVEQCGSKSRRIEGIEGAACKS